MPTRTIFAGLLLAALAAPVRADGLAGTAAWPSPAVAGPEAVLLAPAERRIALACELVASGGPEDVGSLAFALERTSDADTWRQLAFALHLRLEDCPRASPADRALLERLHESELRRRMPELAAVPVGVHEVRARDGVARVAAHVLGGDGRPTDVTWAGLYRRTGDGGWTPLDVPRGIGDGGAPRTNVGPARACGLGPARGAELADLLAAGAAPANTPERLRARDALFRKVVPRLRVEGRPAAAAEEPALLAGVTGVPCAGGRLRLLEARVLGDAARVSVGGDSGGCTVLLRHAERGWEAVMPLGWTLGGGDLARLD